MILFGHIIAQAGYDVKDFPELTDIPVKLLDRKNRELTEVEFNKKLFSKNKDSKKRFREVLEMLTKCSKLPDEISGKLDDSALVLRISGWAPEFLLLF